jgi:iron-sulfur cluster assembly accessory protein
MTTPLIEPMETQATTEPVALTPQAADKLRAILQEKNLPDHGLRVFVAGGGCAGLQYGLAFEAQQRDLDLVVEAHGLKVYVDPVSLEYLTGASIDYVDDPTGAGFRIENPNAMAACGSSCGGCAGGH